MTPLPTPETAVTFSQVLSGLWDFGRIALSVGGAALFYKIDKNQSELFSRLRNLELDNEHIQTEHAFMTGTPHRRKTDKHKQEEVPCGRL